MNSVARGDLRLLPQVAAHADEMFVVLSDPMIYQYENEPPPSIEWLRDRFARLEARRSPDGRQQWLNWVIQISTAELIGYVQATILPTGRAAIAYVLCSGYWGRGLAYRAVDAMISELVASYPVQSLSAVLKIENRRSLRLVERLQFRPAPVDTSAEFGVEPGEVLMLREV